MNCPFDKEKLSGYYDGELGAAERSEVERHIASCSECLRDLGELKSAALLVKDLPRLRAPQSIAEGVSREIQAAGKLHSMAKVRRVVLWAAAAAAGVFVVMNVAVLSRQAPAPVANEPTVALAPAARPAAPTMAAPRIAEERSSADRAGASEPEARRQLEARKYLGEGAEKRASGEVLEEAKKLDQAREKAAAPAGPAAKPSEALAKADQAPPASAAAPAPVPPAAPGRPAPAPAAPPADALRAESGLAADKEKPAAAKEADAARKSEADSKAKAGVAAAGAPAELPPAQFNVVARELAKARPRLEDSLKKMGLSLPPPPPQPMKQPRNRDAENTIVLELTDAQLARLQADLEKPGDARLVQTPTVEPVLPGFRGNGLFGKKDAPTVGGKSASAGKDRELKDGKEADDAAALGAGPRRKVTLHLVESKNLPPAEGEPAPPQKN